ncbi:MAG: dihydroneopterin aldolase [Pseudomonadota bacterium]
MMAFVELTGLELPVSLGTYGPDDVVPDVHLLDLTLGLDAAHVHISGDGMEHVFDYDPLVAQIDALARDGHYDTQEWLMTRIVRACAAYPEIQSVDIHMSKRPVLHGSGQLGVRLQVTADDLAVLRS